MLKRKLIPKLIYIDAETGEETIPTEEEKQQIDSAFFKMYNDGALTLAKLGLSRTAYRLALYMWAKMAYQNLFTYDRQRISTTLKLNPSVISMALRELLQVGFLKQIPDAIKQYLINPKFGFRGTNNTSVKKWFYILSEEKADKIYDDYVKQEETKKAEKEKQKTDRLNALADLIKKSEKHGTNQRQKLLDYLKAKANENRVVYKLVKDIVEDLEISERVVIEFLKFLEEHELISRPKRGEIQLSEELVV